MISATQSNHPLASVAGRETELAALNLAQKRIRTSRMRVTKPRVALIEALLRQSGPVSIDRIHQEVSVRSCDLVSIYRCLAAFETVGLVRRSYLHNGTCLYEQTISADRRYHLVCKRCGRTEPVDYALPAGVEQTLQDKGYVEISHVVEFFGVCPACQQVAPGAERGTGVPAMSSD